MHVDHSITADQTGVVLERLVAQRGRAPEYLRCDNGPETTAHALIDWCRQTGATTRYHDPGAPWQNGYAESFHSRVRDELLDVELFSCLADARADRRLA
jgi:transposase InsO family protein